MNILLTSALDQNHTECIGLSARKSSLWADGRRGGMYLVGLLHAGVPEEKIRQGTDTT